MPPARYEAFRFYQTGKKGPLLVLFHASASEILTWASVEELTPQRKGHQRPKKEAKVEAIRKFMEADQRNTIPTAVTLAFGKGAATFKAEPESKNRGLLQIKDNPKAAAIVDGQHRLDGLSVFDPDTRVAVVALLNADAVEKAFQFLVINNKATRVPVNHTKALLARMSKTELAERLRGARVSFDAEGIKDVDLVNRASDSPFYRTIDWAGTPKELRMVQATAIESSLDYIAGLRVSQFDDRDVRRSIFLTIWKRVKETWPTLWHKDSRLLSKVGVVCLTRFIVDLIVGWSDNDTLKIDLSDLEKIDELTLQILELLHPGFWTAPWAERAHGGFDTNQGRDRVIAALKQVYRNVKDNEEWFADIDIIDTTGLSEAPNAKRPKPRRNN